MSSRFSRVVVATLLMACIMPAVAQTVAAPPDLNTAQIVARIEQANQARNDELKQYSATRHYNVEYRGFATKLAAAMVVAVTFNADSGKSFQIVSQAGSNMLCDKVLKKALESEKEASQNPAASALTAKNYHFQRIGTEMAAGRSAYVLAVEPVTSSKFLYRGKIWVDAADFAVLKMETEPAKNPSFWISKTLIHATTANTAGFWLPQTLRSETRVRLGGMATLTIDYGSYAVVARPALHRAGN